MLNFDLDKMLFVIPAGKHKKEEIAQLLGIHPEIQFVSFVGIDIGGHDTDEKIPVKVFLSDLDKFINKGVQTDGSSVVLPKIADLNNAKVDMIPDMDVNWYVDFNFDYIDDKIGLPVGTLRIPSFLIHNDDYQVGSRVVLKRAIDTLQKELPRLIKDNPYVLEHIGIQSADDIKSLDITCATELEFWVKTPDDQADREQLTTAEVLKEQYWKRTVGPVRTALEETISILDRFGFQMEMGHKEVGGVKAKMGHSGRYDHVMEQLEIDWKYASPMQAADNESHIKYVVKDIFRLHGLDVTFMAKPIEGVSGCGEHTHLGIAAKLKNGKTINLFSPMDFNKDFISPIGYGALMGLLKNYDIMNPFIASTNDALNRLQPGYEAPVCTVTSMGHSVKQPSRNRTVLVGLIRERDNSKATRFELRSPNPKSNTYLVVAAACMAMLDGIIGVLEAGKTPAELEKSISKKAGEDDFYLERDRQYRSEKDVFDAYSPEDRDRLFGKAPRTVWESIRVFDENPKKMEIYKRGNVMDDISLESYKEATLGQWATELHNRIVPEAMDVVRKCRKAHSDDYITDYDIELWENISRQRVRLGKESLNEKSLLGEIKTALDHRDYDRASELQIEMSEALQELIEKYSAYKRNLF